MVLKEAFCHLSFYIYSLSEIETIWGRLFKIIFHFKSLLKRSFKIVEAPHFNILKMGRKCSFKKHHFSKHWLLFASRKKKIKNIRWNILIYSVFFRERRITLNFQGSYNFNGKGKYLHVSFLWNRKTISY